MLNKETGVFLPTGEWMSARKIHASGDGWSNDGRFLAHDQDWLRKAINSGDINEVFRLDKEVTMPGWALEVCDPFGLKEAVLGYHPDLSELLAMVDAARMQQVIAEPILGRLSIKGSNAYVETRRLLAGGSCVLACDHWPNILREALCKIGALENGQDMAAPPRP